MNLLMRGTQLRLGIMGAKPFDSIRDKMVYEVRRDDPAQVEAMLHEHADCKYHPVRTFKMGPASDSLALVDDRLRVRGMDGMRIADASIMPYIICGNTSAPSIMIDEEYADMIAH